MSKVGKRVSREADMVGCTFWIDTGGQAGKTACTERQDSNG